MRWPRPFNIIIKRPPGLILDRRPDGLIQIYGTVCAEVCREGEVIDYSETNNIVTDSGDLFYAYRATDAQPTDALFTTGSTKTFDGVMELYTGVTAAPGKATNRGSLTAGTLVDSTQFTLDSAPARNNSDSSNTGKATDAVTYKRTFTVSQAIASGIDDVILTNPSPGASENILMWADGLGKTKTGSDTMTIWINHLMNGT